MADVSADLKNWSNTASSNSPSGTTTIGTGLDDNLRQIQATVKQDLAHVGADIASAGTTDLGAVPGLFHTITGAVTITGFGTVASGIWKVLTFSGAPQITYNATSMITPGSVNLQLAAKDSLIAESLGSGNWKIHPFYTSGLYAALAGSAAQAFAVASLTSTGLLDISGAAAGQIKFPATQNASANANTLDDYEEGTFTPSLGGTTTYFQQEGFYTKIGNLVSFQLRVNVNSIGSGSTTAISGMPFAFGPVAATSADIFPVYYSGSSTSVIHMLAIGAGIGSTTLNLLSNVAAAAGMSANAIFANSTLVIISGSYRV